MNSIFSSMYKPALKVAVIYFVLGLSWIFFTDLMVEHLTQDEGKMILYQILKGWSFIAVSALIIYILVIKEIRKKNQLIEIINEKGRWSDILISNLPVTAIYLLDTNLKHIVAYGSGLKEQGYHSEYVKNKYLYEIQLEPKLNQFLKSSYNQILKGDNIKTEIDLNNKWYEFMGLLIKDKKNDDFLIAAIFVDITEKKQWVNSLQLQKIETDSVYEKNKIINDELNEKIVQLSEANNRLEESEKKYRMFFDNINDAAYIYEVIEGKRPGKFLEVNQKMIEYLGYTRNELLEMCPDQIVTIESIGKIRNSGSFFEKANHQYVEMEYLTKSGKKIPVELSLHYFQYDGKHMVFATVRDIRERIKYIRKLKKAKEKAEGSDKLKSAFLANISHEIRTPMNGIIGFTDLIGQDELSSEQRAGYVVLIKRSIDQLLRIINDILDISKIDTGQIKLVKNDISLNDLMDELANYATDLKIQHKKDLNIICTKDLARGEDIINTDGVRLKQIFQHLISNAEKFSESGEIKFGYTFDGNNTINCFVRDSGIGISQDKITAVFDRFRQADDSHTRQFGGIGLGLPIAKGLIELMGGSISLESEVGSGTNIGFILPVQKSKLLVTKEVVIYPDDEPDLTNKTILIVEDNPENSALLSEYTTLNGGEVLVTAKGKDAIDICRINPNIDLIFMDIRLPDISGVEATKYIKEILPDIPVIAQTAYASTDDMEMCLKAGCDDYIAKPIEMKTFYRIVSKYIH